MTELPHRRKEAAPRDPGLPPLPPIATREELLELLTVEARRGIVSAQRALLEELKHEAPPKATSIVDEIAARRRRANP